MTSEIDVCDLSHLDARDDAEVSDEVDEGSSVVRLLVQRFMEQNNAGHILAQFLHGSKLKYNVSS